MDWRRSIEHQNPVSPSAHESVGHRALDASENIMNSDEFRKAARDPDLISLALQAKSYAVRMHHEKHDA
jgi:hypothetical protein